MQGNKVMIYILLIVSQMFWTCSSADESQLVADFTYTKGQSDNHLVFSNQSEGDYYSIFWDFGNGEEESTTNKSKTFEVYYPKAGEYTVQMTIKDDIGNSAQQSKIVTIAQDDPDYVEPDGLIWSEEFDGPTIDNTVWTFETGAGGWGNNELQMYTSSGNASIQNGKLIITAQKVNDNKEAGSYTSVRMITKGKKEFTYGKIEIRAKLPSGTGIWPAIWMLGGNIDGVGWPACGEIDIMEYVGYQPNTVHSTVHMPAGYGGTADGDHKTLETAEEDFHIYGIIWSESSILFYTDTPDNVTHLYAPAVKNGSTWPFDKPHFLILNVAVGGNWGGAQGIDNSIFPQSMEVDYVRVYELPINYQ